MQSSNVVRCLSLSTFATSLHNSYTRSAHYTNMVLTCLVTSEGMWGKDIVKYGSEHLFTKSLYEGQVLNHGPTIDAKHFILPRKPKT